MRKILLLLLFPVLLFSDKFIVEYTTLPKNYNNKAIIKKYSRYKMIVVQGDYEYVKRMFPESKIYEDKKVKATYIPNDTYFSYQWNLLDKHYNLSNILDRGILGSKNIILGILDTGIAFENYTIPLSEADKVYSSDDSFHKYGDFDNINFVAGYDYVSDDNHPNDMNGHGTAVTSIIASSINNSSNLAGIVKNISIMPLRVLDENGEGSVDDIISGIEFAIENGCNVLNLSLAGPPGDSLGWHPLHIAINDAKNNNIAVVCATGNDSVNQLSYPAGFDEAIAVGAVDYFMDRALYSQYGENLDFMAPGGVVYQDNDNDGYYDGGILSAYFDLTNNTTDVSKFALYYFEGTSMAAPHISALIAMLYSLGIKNVDDIENLLIENSVDLGDSNYDSEYGWGYPLPDSLFLMPFIIHFTNYDFMSNGFSIVINTLDTMYSIDSFYIKSKTINKRIPLNKINTDYNTNVCQLNSGIYNCVLYYSSDTEKDSIQSQIIFKSPLDTLSYIYNGKYKINIANNNTLLKINNNSFKIIDSEKPMLITYQVSKNPSFYHIIHNGKEIKEIKYENHDIVFTTQGKGYYYINYTAGRENNIKAYTKKNIKTVFLTKNSINWYNGDYKIYNTLGKRVRKGNGLLIDMSKMPKGIYYIYGDNVKWKIIKSF